MSVSLKKKIADVLFVTSEEPGSVFLERADCYNEAISSRYHTETEYFCVHGPIFQYFHIII